MKTSLKIAIALFLVVVVLIGGLTFFAKSYLTDERIRTYIVDTAEKSLGRKVGLGAIQVSIFKGISVKDFEIKEKASETPFVKAESVITSYSIHYTKLYDERLSLESLISDVARASGTGARPTANLSASRSCRRESALNRGVAGKEKMLKTKASYNFV